MSRQPGSIDVHQHLWSPTLIEALRMRRTPPRLQGWTLTLGGEPPFEVDPDDHDLARRLDREPAGRARVIMSLSTPLGIENLPTDEAEPLLQAWRAGVATWDGPVTAWASVSAHAPNLGKLNADLNAGFVGLQVGADLIQTPAALEALAPVLAVCEAASKPVFIHPGPTARAEGVPNWWAPVVGYVAQLQAAWWSWHTVGRSLVPDLRICFAAAAGLAPIQHERRTSRGGGPLGPIDPNTFVETSSYGPQAIDALIRVLGVDVLVLGSDRPYAEPLDIGASDQDAAQPAGIRSAHRLLLGDAAAYAITTANPTRLIEGDQR